MLEYMYGCAYKKTSGYICIQPSSKPEPATSLTTPRLHQCEHNQIPTTPRSIRPSTRRYANHLEVEDQCIPKSGGPPICLIVFLYNVCSTAEANFQLPLPLLGDPPQTSLPSKGRQLYTPVASAAPPHLFCQSPQHLGYHVSPSASGSRAGPYHIKLQHPPELGSSAPVCFRGLLSDTSDACFGLRCEPGCRPPSQGGETWIQAHTPSPPFPDSLIH